MGRKNYIILFLTLIVTGVTVLFSVTDVSAVDVEDVLPKATSGYAGNTRQKDITWTYDTTTKTLTFNGSGDMTTNSGAYDIANKSDLKSEMLEGLGTWYIWHKEAEHIVIGEGITDIGAYSFYNFREIEDISIPNSVLTINFQAFGYAGLKNITIPRSVEIICDWAFKGVKLKSITIPGSVKTIGVGAFAESELEEITIEYGVEKIDEEAFSSCESLEEIKFPESVKFEISDWGVLADCENLKKVTLLPAMRVIPEYFCDGCTSLKEITIPKSVKTIGYAAFSNCISLKKITLPKSLKRIEGFAFESAALKSIKLPNTLKEIGEGAFCACGNLEKITLPKSLKKIEDGTFQSSALKSIKLPKSLEKIEGGAFDATFLKTIEIPENVKVLGGGSYGIFSDNKKLKTVKIKSRKLKKVYGNAFKKFPSQATIIVPKGKKKSYSKMFYKAGLSKKVKIEESKTW